MRSDDLVGRLADGEFGIFLPGASAENARHAGERIRQEVAKVYFAPGATGGNGKTSLIDVNVAGVFFEQQLGFEDMFRSAARQLEAASPGSRIELKRIGPSRPSDRSRTRPSDGAAFPPQGLSVSTPTLVIPGLDPGTLPERRRRALARRISERPERGRKATAWLPASLRPG